MDRETTTLVYPGNENELEIRYFREYDMFQMTINKQSFRCHQHYVEDIITAMKDAIKEETDNAK